jgi:5-methylcytosine-specific restriction endonuclease McrA
LPKPLWRRERNREYDAKRSAELEYRAWYKTGRWRALRTAQLATQPLCERCQSRGVLKAATVCHHKKAHKGDPILFWDAGNLASSCDDCHNTDEQRVERGGKARQQVGVDGWPTS